MWAVIGAATVFMLHRTTLGRAIYAVGNRERAAYLSGVDTRRVVLQTRTEADGQRWYWAELPSGAASVRVGFAGRDGRILAHGVSLLEGGRNSAEGGGNGERSSDFQSLRSPIVVCVVRSSSGRERPACQPPPIAL